MDELQIGNMSIAITKKNIKNIVNNWVLNIGKKELSVLKENIGNIINK